jgi:hypothetical protein
MSTKTLGTSATTSLAALSFLPGIGGMANADVATIQQAIKDDITVTHPTWPGAFSTNGLLFVPNRGLLKILPGDYVAYDDRGWPVLLSSDTIANGSSWTHS